MSFVSAGLSLCTVMTTGLMADGKGGVQKRSSQEHQRYDTNPRPILNSLLWLRELKVAFFPHVDLGRHPGTEACSQPRTLSAHRPPAPILAVVG